MMLLLRPLPARAPMHVVPATPSSAVVAPLKRVAQPVPSSDVAIEDWDILLGAVKARLRRTVGEWPAAAPRPRGDDAAGRARASVLECVAALDQLHTTLAHELDRRRRLDSEARDA